MFSLIFLEANAMSNTTTSAHATPEKEAAPEKLTAAELKQEKAKAAYEEAVAEVAKATKTLVDAGLGATQAGAAAIELWRVCNDCDA
jgi:hypothetical protein